MTLRIVGPDETVNNISGMEVGLGESHPSSDDEKLYESTDWLCYLTVRFPEGTTVNPRLRYRLRNEIDRISAFKIENEKEVSLIFEVYGNIAGEAMTDARIIGYKVLSILGLNEYSIVRRNVSYMPLDDLKQDKPYLTLLTDKEDGGN